MVLERISPSWSGLWQDTDPRSPCVLRGISPVPLQSLHLQNALQCPLPVSFLQSLRFQNTMLAPVPEVSPGSLEAFKCPPSHPLLPPPPLLSGSPSARPQPTIYAVRAWRDYHPPMLPWLEFPSNPPPASEAWTRPVDPSARPWLLASSSPPWPGSPLAPPGSLVPPALPWSGINHPAPRDSTPLASPHPFVPLAPSGPFIPSAPPLSSVALAPLGSTLPRRSPAPSAPPRTSGSSPSPLLFGSPSQPRAHPPPAPPPLVGPLESAVIPPPWLLPPSAPLWATVVAAAWVPPGSFCSGSLMSLPWLLPPSSPPWTLCAGPLPGIRPPPEPPISHSPLPIGCCFHGARTHLPGGGQYVRIMDLSVCVFVPCDPVSVSQSLCNLV